MDERSTGVRLSSARQPRIAIMIVLLTVGTLMGPAPLLADDAAPGELGATVAAVMKGTCTPKTTVIQLNPQVKANSASQDFGTESPNRIASFYGDEFKVVRAPFLEHSTETKLVSDRKTGAIRIVNIGKLAADTNNNQPKAGLEARQEGLVSKKQAATD